MSNLMQTKLFLIVLIFVSVGLNTAGQTLLKLGADANQWNLEKIFLLGGGIFAYGLSTVLYIVLLSKINLSLAYPIMIGLTLCSTTAVGALILSEKVGFVQWMGVGLILSGLFAIAVGKG